MKQEKQAQRRSQIRAAAYAILAEKGYKGSSMLAIAKRAKASNETLYAWYGNKQNLFRSLIEENARELADALLEASGSSASLEQTLSVVGRLLLELVTGPKAVALNRAAASDATESGALGPALAEMGRGTIAPLFEDLFQSARERGEIQFENSVELTEIYLSALIGDLQIRCVTGAMEPPDAAEIERRVSRATWMLKTLFPMQAKSSGNQ